MPAKSRQQQKAAFAELSRRKEGTKRQDKATRPFGSISLTDLKKYTHIKK